MREHIHHTGRQKLPAAFSDNNLADKTEFEARNLFDWTLDDWDAVWNKLGSVDRVLIDPPREGAISVKSSVPRIELPAQPLQSFR